MSLKLIYPINNTKVSNPNITFRWERIIGEQRYELVIFRLTRSPSLRWEKIFSGSFTNNSYPSREILDTNSVYHCILVANDDPERPLRFIHPSFGGGIPDLEQVPKLHPELAYLEHTSSSFYVKKRVNYLEKYLKIKGSHLKPIGPTIPLLFYLLDRYYRWKKDPDNIQLTPLEENFSKTMNAVPQEFRSLNKLDKLLRNYRSEDLNSLKILLFSPTFAQFPQDADADTWINNALNALFSGTWLDEVKSAGQKKKTMDLEFKHPLFMVKDVLLDGDLHIPIDPRFIGTTSNHLNMHETYLLKIIPQKILPHSGDSAVIPLQLVKREEEYFLHSPGSNLSSFDAASFKAELWKKDPHNPEADGELWWSGGNLKIKGGIPIILSVEPNSVPEGSSQEIKITVRDGGQGKRIKLRQGNQTHEIPADQNHSLIRFDQTLKYQVFTFKLTDCADTINPETYDLTFQNAEEVNSVNSVAFAVNGFEYRVWITELKCIDESDPEWFGNDSISFQTFINTRKFLQLPTSSKVYHGFNDGKRRTRFSNHDNCIYPYAVRPDGRRIIEGHLSINIAIYEHDDLEWLDWLINAVIDLVQSFLAHLVDAFTLGLGGYIISAGLEASGLNDMREQAIDSMVAGWEVEVLHEGRTSLLPSTENTYKWSKEMHTEESRYKVTFKANRIVQA